MLMEFRPLFHKASVRFCGLASKRFRRTSSLAVVAMLLAGAVGFHNIYLGRYRAAALQCGLLVTAMGWPGPKVFVYAALVLLFATNILDLLSIGRHVRDYNLKHAANLI